MATREFLSPAEAASQGWLTPPVLLLALALLKVALFARSLAASITLAKSLGLLFCSELEVLLARLEAVPERVGSVTNSVLDVALQASNLAASRLVTVIAKVASGLVSMLLEVYLGTYTCLLTAAIKGFLEFLTDVLRDITDAVQTAVSAAAGAINSALSGLSTVVNTVVDGVSAVESLFGALSSTSVLQALSNVTLSVSELLNITIPTLYLSDIEDLALDVPTFENVLGNLLLVLTAPIEAAAAEFADASEDANSRLVWPELAASNTLASLARLCQAALADLESAASLVLTVLDYVLIALGIFAVLVGLASMGWQYWRQLRKQRLLAALAAERDEVRVGNALSQFEAGIWGKLWKQSSWRWLGNFLATKNLTWCLWLALADWAVCLVQFLITQEAKRLLEGVTSSQAPAIVDTALQARAYAQRVQMLLDALALELDSVLFETVRAHSARVLAEVESVQAAINTTIVDFFGGTFLESPLQTVVYCTVGRKIDMIEEGLAWLLDNLAVELPQLNLTVIEQAVLGSVEQSGASALMGSALSTAVESLESATATEFIVVSVFAGIWLFYAVCGTIVVLVRRKPSISWPQRLSEAQKSSYGLSHNDPYESFPPRLEKAAWPPHKSG